MIKNATPKQLAFYTALSIAVMVLLLLVVLQTLSLLSSGWLGLFFILVVSFIISYLTILYVLQRFIYRKVKLIYKSIHAFKRTAKDKVEMIDINEDIIGQVEKEVNQWGVDSQKEIESLKSMEAYRRNYLGNISHELKTPIFNIQGYLHTLLEGGLEDENINYNYLNRAATNVERLHTIIQDLESISRLESGKVVLDMQNFDIRKLAAEIFEDMEFTAKERDVQLVFKEGADSPFIVNADRENIRQVLANLIVNSIKYGKIGGYTKVGFYDMDKYILIEVADNGIGIKEKHLPRLFERFYRVDKSRSRDQGGSGLGLSIVKHIIEAHKQTINVRSTIDLGSTIGFTLAKGK